MVSSTSTSSVVFPKCLQHCSDDLRSVPVLFLIHTGVVYAAFNDPLVKQSAAACIHQRTTFIPPPDWPKMVTLSGSPPKASIFSWIQIRAATRSSFPAFAEFLYFSPNVFAGDRHFFSLASSLLGHFRFKLCQMKKMFCLHPFSTPLLVFSL